ncbi:MAG: FAD-dependent oxidoreductase [Hyphomicrobiaceae bacterium]
MSEADVIVVGGGGSGLAAAAEAAGLGRKVILVEKGTSLGGSTAWSVGSISATNTPQQRAAGIVDHPDAHFEDLEALSGAMANRDNRALRRILVDNITETMAWLESAGLVFVGPNPEPPHRLPRMHNVLPNSRAFPEMLGQLCRQRGVDIRLGTLADGLMVESGKVVGIVTRRTDANGPTGEVRARGGIVLAGGDFAANAAMKSELAGPATVKINAVNPGATGDAIRIARAIGAEVVNGDIVRGPIIRFVPPQRESLLRRLPPKRWLAKSLALAQTYLPDAIKRRFAMEFLVTALGPWRGLYEAGAILVNRNGQRFADELGAAASALPEQPDGMGYIVMDARIAAQFSAWPHFISTAPGVAYAYLADYKRNRRDIYHEAEEAGALALKLGVPEEALRRAIAESGGSGRPALGGGPFVALGPVKSYVIFTDGGLKVTERLEVAGADGQPIPGLYAAGSTGQGGVLLEGHGHHLGWAFVSGRIAGRNAALEIEAAISKETA